MYAADKDRILLAMITMTGLILLTIGGLLAYYFNAIAASMPLFLRVLGFMASLGIVLAGGHMLVAGIHTLKRIMAGGGGRS